MKKLHFTHYMTLALGAVLVMGLSQNASAQASASKSANGSAMIVTAIAISKVQDLSFGVIVSDATGGTVTVSEDGTRSTSGPVLLTQSMTGSTVQQAKFTVTGATDYVYTITLPTSAVTLTGTGTTPPTMTVDTFTSDPSGTGTLTLGTSTLEVGAKLHVGAAQAAGAYTGTFSVTVAYQ